MLERAASNPLFPDDGFIPPMQRTGQTNVEVALPEGTVVFSADNHISVGQDIWFERFPARMKDRAPRVWFADGIYHLGFDGKSFYPPEMIPGLSQFDGRPGSTKVASRLEDMDMELVTGELVFPNGVLALPRHPDPELRELCFRIYNEYIAELQAQAPGRFYGVGLINWWDPKGTRKMLAELRSLGIRTFLLPFKALGLDGKNIDWTHPSADPILDEIEESGLPISHHIGETPPTCHYNRTTVGFLNSSGSFRERFGEYTFGGIIDRHPGLQIGWFEGNISWVLTAIQDGRHSYASYQRIHNWQVQHDVEYYWRNHMHSSFIFDELGLEMIDRIGPDRVMWSSDYPHNESSFGLTRSSLQQVMDAIDPAYVPDVLGGNVRRFLGLT
jgi:predicted TIM-barrel fold metal-dependent hydrolase